MNLSTDDKDIESKETETKATETKGEQVERFPSAKILLSVIQKEYDYEANRAKNLEARTGIFMAFTGVLLAFVTGNIKLSSIYTIKTTSVIQALPHNIVILSVVLILICLLFTIYNLVKVISLKNYKRLSMENFSENYLIQIKNYTEEKAAICLVASYHDVIKRNTEINNEKALYFNRAVKSLLYALVLTIFAYIFSSFIMIP